MTAAFGAAILACGLASGATAEPVKIRAGWVVTPNTLTPVIFAKKELLKHYGVSYTYEPVHFKGTPVELTALATGDIDFGTIAFSTLGSAINNAGLSDIRIVADGFQDGAEGYYSTEYKVLKDSPIKTIEDLKGKVLAANGIGGGVDMAIRALLRHHHLEDKKDYSLIEVAFPNMRAMLEDRKIDLAGTSPPWVLDEQVAKTERTLFTMKDALGRTQMIVTVGRKGFIEKNRAALIDYHEDLIRALQWFLDPAHREEAIDIIAAYTKQPRATFEKYLFTKADYYRDPWLRPDLKALQHNVDVQRELGFLASPIDVTKYADLSLIDAAAKRLK